MNTDSKQGNALARPVLCKFCSEQMYYQGDERHRPEVRVTVYGDTDRTLDSFHSHTECWNQNTRSRASVAGDALDRIQAAVDAASEERYQSLREWEQLSDRWKSEGDMSGWNFHQGMAAGANWVDIYYHRVTREVKALRDAASSPSPAGPQQQFVSEVDQWTHDLATAGWIAEAAFNWRAPDGSLWRGPAGAWKELQRRSAAAPESEQEQIARRIVGTVFDNTAAGNETLKRTIIERITDYLTGERIANCLTATPPDTPEGPDLLWVNPEVGFVANHRAGSGFLPYRQVVDGDKRAVFTDEELDYIYHHLDLDVNRDLFSQIEKKIRQQIVKYREADSATPQ